MSNVEAVRHADLAYEVAREALTVALNKRLKRMPPRLLEQGGDRRRPHGIDCPIHPRSDQLGALSPCTCVPAYNSCPWSPRLSESAKG